MKPPIKSYQEILDEDRRLVILRFLAEGGYSLNTSVLHSALESFGHRVSRDRVKGDAAWLAEQGLVTLDDVGPVTVLTVKERGLDVAAGRIVAPGVKRPGPGM